MRILIHNNYNVLAEELTCARVKEECVLDFCEIKPGALHTGTRIGGRPLRTMMNHRRQYEPEHRRSGFIVIRLSVLDNPVEAKRARANLANAFQKIYHVMYDKVFYGDDELIHADDERREIWITIYGKDPWSVRPWQRDESQDVFQSNRITVSYFLGPRVPIFGQFPQILEPLAPSRVGLTMVFYTYSEPSKPLLQPEIGFISTDPGY
ncbi:Oidioi.mRNA.OKI2018_I69.YSR.g17046.t1.cds [Oikopleura dioica]|uniref:Oidioi.mRNA.OKI2018_I69.YSR.g17046.t1.cds n=1 Tax=Oikopleura dioica TaxID=34765 RepID=A0ABN7SLS9_OIKDI|nr:Oidioi.mRNA.OKI2018_I69.YSR.g17046.t1.cds [Oikopleura dioica]